MKIKTTTGKYIIDEFMCQMIKSMVNMKAKSISINDFEVKFVRSYIEDKEEIILVEVHHANVSD